MVRINCLQSDRKTFADAFIDEKDVLSIKPFDEMMMIITYKNGGADVVREYVSADDENFKIN